MIQISEYTTIQNPKNVWQGWRNPVKYSTLEEFDIDVSKLKFHPVAEFQKTHNTSPRQSLTPVTPDNDTTPLSIVAAKRGMAVFYGVPLEAIEVLIRG